MAKKKIIVKGSIYASTNAQIKNGTCSVVRVPVTSDGGESLVVQFFPKGWAYPVTVDFGESDLPPFIAGTPVRKILENPVETYAWFIGKQYKVVLRHVRGKARVDVHETFTENVVSGVGVVKKPFATFEVAVSRPGETGGGKEFLFAASVATYDGDSGDLTSFCAPFRTAKDAVAWVKTDWNEQAGACGGKKMTPAQEKKLLADLDKDGFADLESPAKWCLWHQWKIVRSEA